MNSIADNGSLLFSIFSIFLSDIVLVYGYDFGRVLVNLVWLPPSKNDYTPPQI